MSNFNLSKLTPAQLDELASKARAAAKDKRKKEKEEIIIKIGTLFYKKVDTVLSCHTLDIKLRESFAKIMDKTIPNPPNAASNNNDSISIEKNDIGSV